MNKHQFATVSIVPRHAELQTVSKKSTHPSTKRSTNNEIWPATSSTNIDISNTPGESTDAKDQKSIVPMFSTSNDRVSINKDETNMKTDSKKPKTDNFKLFVIVSVIALTICALAALSIGIYFLVRNGNTSTVTAATTASSNGLNWSKTGTTVAGTGTSGTTTGFLSYPQHIIMDQNNTMYIADTGNHRVQKYNIGSSSGITVAGQSNGIPGTSAFDLNTPVFVLLDSSNNLYVTDNRNHRVQCYRNGNASGITIAGTGTAGSGLNQLNFPRGLSFDLNTGSVYIADTNNHRIVRYLSGAASGTVVAGGTGAGTSITQLSSPYSVHFDTTTSSLYILNYGAHNLVQWVIGTSSWILVVGGANGGSGSTSIALTLPEHFVLDAMNNLYIADSGNDRIQFFSAAQTEATTIAGVTNRPGAMSNVLNDPSGLILDSDFNLYVADTGNHRIQRFERY